MSSVEIREAVEVARAQHGPFVFIPSGATEEMRAALEGLATEMGREPLVMAGASRAQILAQELAERDVPEIPVTDSRTFLKNLKAIARGDVRVK
jgi:hypothetical protein